MEQTSLCAASLRIGRRTYRCDRQSHGARDMHIAYGRYAWNDDQQFIALEEVQQRWPRLLAAIQWAIIGTTSEARSAIEGYVNGHGGGSEAVMHYGGPLAAIRGGIRGRHALRKLYSDYISRYVPARAA